VNHDEYDEGIVIDLRRIAATVDGVPDGVRDAARAAFLTRDLESEIAALIADSRYEPVRAAEPAQGRWLLSFEGGGIHIDLEIEDHHPDVRVIGQLSGVAVDDCELDTGGRAVRVDVDHLGRFIVPGLAPGPVRLRCRVAGDRRVTTTWVRI